MVNKEEEDVSNRVLRGEARLAPPRFGVQGLGHRVQGLGFRVLNSRFRVWGSGFGVQGLGFRVQSLGYMVQGLGCRVQGLGFRVWGSGCRVEPRAARRGQACSSPRGSGPLGSRRLPVFGPKLTGLYGMSTYGESVNDPSGPDLTPVEKRMY